MASTSGAQNDLSAFEGILPIVPQDLTVVQRAEWLEALEFESEHFEEYPHAVHPFQLQEPVSAARGVCLMDLCEDGLSTVTLEWTASKIDRLLLSGQATDQLAHYMPVLVRMILHDHHQFDSMVVSFHQYEPVTPSWWFEKLVDRTPSEHRPAVQPNIIQHAFKLLAVSGAYACVKSSIMAAGMLVSIMDNEAEPYLCGYKLCDVQSAREICTELLDLTFPGWKPW